MNTKKIMVYSFMALSVVVGLAYAGSEIATVEPRPDVKLKVLLIEPIKPNAVLILYAGGTGKLELSSFLGNPTIENIMYQQNFIVRVREKFVESGFVVALPDIVSDLQEYNGVYRTSEAHAKEIQDVISFLKNRYSLPIWIIGTSASSFSVANAAITQGTNISGAIFSSSITMPGWQLYKYPNGIASMELSLIKTPVFIAVHTEDKCENTPPEGADLIKNNLTSSPKVEVKYYVGGKQPNSKPCDALSQHGFYGVEDQVVADMVAFIRAN